MKMTKARALEIIDGLDRQVNNYGSWVQFWQHMETRERFDFLEYVCLAVRRQPEAAK